MNQIVTDEQTRYPKQVYGLMFIRWRIAIVLFEVAVACDVVITLIYWLFIFQTPETWELGNYYETAIHILPLSFNLIDFSLIHWRFRSNHYVILMAIHIVYTSFNFGFFYVTGRLIYKIINWNNPVLATIIAFCFLLICLFAFFVLCEITDVYESYRKDRLRMVECQRPVLVSSGNMVVLIKHDNES